MQGPLYKWANPFKRWRKRWFVLDKQSGALYYYKGKKKRKNKLRGACMLRHARIGIDDEYNSRKFTITTPTVAFHLRAKDLETRDEWIRSLEDAIELENQKKAKEENKNVGALLRKTLGMATTMKETNKLIRDTIEVGQYLERDKENLVELAEQTVSILDSATCYLTSIKRLKVRTCREMVEGNGGKSEVRPGESVPVSSSEEDDDSLSGGESIASEEDRVIVVYPDEDEDVVGTLPDGNKGSVIRHLLSQVRIGMDLTRVVLPTFVLERRSLLEMYSSFFAHPELFVRIPLGRDPEARMVAVMKWYLSTFHAGRRSSDAKKPYNPILGEVFRCHWDVPGSTGGRGDPIADGPVPWCGERQLAFVSEQVSHHPPVSGIYAECASAGVSFEAHIWTKSVFLGTSICVRNEGGGRVHLLDHGEEYVLTFPHAYARSILTVPWLELGGSVEVTCARTGYCACVEFHTKPFYSSVTNRITARLHRPGEEEEAFMTIEGEWNGAMSASDGEREWQFFNVDTAVESKKLCRPIESQEENESRKVWKNVTESLRENNMENATFYKEMLENKQREEAARRRQGNIQWVPKLFRKNGDGWSYKNSLKDRREGQ